MVIVYFDFRLVQTSVVEVSPLFRIDNRSGLAGMKILQLRKQVVFPKLERCGIV